jgi:hypothetical protein
VKLQYLILAAGLLLAATGCKTTSPMLDVPPDAHVWVGADNLDAWLSNVDAYVQNTTAPNVPSVRNALTDTYDINLSQSGLDPATPIRIVIDKTGDVAIIGKAMDTIPEGARLVGDGYAIFSVSDELSKKYEVFLTEYLAYPLTSDFEVGVSGTRMTTMMRDAFDKSEDLEGLAPYVDLILGAFQNAEQFVFQVSVSPDHATGKARYIGRAGTRGAEYHQGDGMLPTRLLTELPAHHSVLTLMDGDRQWRVLGEALRDNIAEEVRAFGERLQAWREVSKGAAMVVAPDPDDKGLFVGALYPIEDRAAAREAFLAWQTIDFGAMSSAVTRDAYQVDDVSVDIVRSEIGEELDGMFKSVIDAMAVAHAAFTGKRGFLRYGGDLKKVLPRGQFGSGADTDPRVRARLADLPEGTWFYSWISILGIADSVYFNGMNPFFNRSGGKPIDDAGLWFTFSAEDGTGVYALDVPAATIASVIKLASGLF